MITCHPVGSLYKAVSLPLVYRTESPGERLRGLLARPQLTVNEALWITPCNSVHGFFMRYAIDLIYLDAEQRVRKCVTALKPWQISGCLGAHSVIELPAGRIGTLEIQTGWRFQWREA